VVITGAKLFTTVVPTADIAPQTIWIRAYFTVWTVYFLCSRIPQGCQTCCMRTWNCCTEDRSENSTLPLAPVPDVQLRWTSIWLRRFFIIRGISGGFWTGLHAFKPKRKFNRRQTIEW